jgi:hypothetical protein
VRLTARPRWEGLAGGFILILAWAVAAPPVTAQIAENRSIAYLTPSDASDGRALWLNPAGVAARPEASIYAHFSVRDPGAKGQLGQVTAGFNAQGLSFGYQGDEFGGQSGRTYRIGFGTSASGLALGLAFSMYRGDTKGTGWDVGARYQPLPPLTLALVARNIGQPLVRGIRLHVQAVPAATLSLWNNRLALSGVATFTEDDAFAGYAFGAGTAFRLGVPLGASARLDLNRDFQRSSFTFGLSVGMQNLVGLLATTPGDVSKVSTGDIYGVVSRTSPKK